MQKRLFHLSFCIVLLLSLDCFAGGTYQVGQDQGGIYFQTDNNGGWYIGKSDLKDFKIGQTGAYSIGKDRNGTFLITDTNRKFYLDMKALEKQVFENERTNQEYDRKMEIMQQKEARKNAEQARLKAQEREARADRELYLKIEEQKLKETRRLNQELINARNREAEQSQKPNLGRSSRASGDIGQCMGECASEQGICIMYCQGNGQCIGNCGAAHSRCIARCK